MIAFKSVNRFIFSEPAKEHVQANIPFTNIPSGCNVMIGDKFYRVLNQPKPEPFMYRDSFDKSWRGWKFEAQEITDVETIKLLNERKMACLVLNPDNVDHIGEYLMGKRGGKRNVRSR